MAIKLPHMPVWVYDLEADEDCSLMSLAEYGAYMRLLQRQWIEGSIPVDPTRLARLLRVTTDEMDSIWPVLASKFVQDGRGRQKNRRLDSEREAALRKVEVNRANGKKGGRPKESDGITEEEPNGSIRTSGSGSDSGSEKKKGQIDLMADALWELAPKKARERSSKAEVRKQVASLGSDRPTLEAITDSYRAWLKCEDWVKNDGQYVMGLHRWVKDGKFYHRPEPASQGVIDPGGAPIKTGWRE